MTSQEYTYDLKIPKDRIAVLIGTDGKVKRDLAALTGVKIDIDSEEGDVTISGTEPLKLFTLKEIITAIARGFNPDTAKLLMKVDYALEIIDTSDFAKSKNAALRMKGRVIGNEGRSRRTLEDLTDCAISVYGKTVAIIGDAEKVPLAKQAIESLLRGAKHANVYKWLENQRRELSNRPPEADFIKENAKK